MQRFDYIADQSIQRNGLQAFLSFQLIVLIVMLVSSQPMIAL
jgi:hypothetical protein